MDKVYNKEMMFIFKGKAKDILKDKFVIKTGGRHSEEMNYKNYIERIILKHEV